MLPQGFPDLPPIDIRAGFFLFQFPKSVEELVDYIARLQAYKENYLETPILPPYELKLTAIRGGHKKNKISVWPGKRIVPDLVAHPTAFEQLDALQLVLTRPLAVGEHKWSQVWQGAVTSRLAPTVAPAPVAVKIYQESLFPHNPDIPDLLGDDDEWRPGAMTAALEAYAFDEMRELQGDLVPWSYGFFKADHLSMALHRIHSYGFIHGDFKGQNVIFSTNPARDKQDPISFVITDFGSISLIDSVEPETMTQVDAIGVRFVLEELGVPKDVTIAWDEARRSDSPAWRTIFSYLDKWGGLYPFG